jgi:hypothetical protein
VQDATQDTTQDRAGQLLPVADAAVALGLTAETLRKRLWRGQAHGVKRDGQWYAWVPAAAAGPVPDRQDHVQDGPGPERDQAQDGAGPVLVAELRDRVHWLEAALERRDRDLAAAIERLREAHLLIAQRPALAAGATEPIAAPPRRAWWRRWLDRLQAAQ